MRPSPPLADSSCGLSDPAANAIQVRFRPIYFAVCLGRPQRHAFSSLFYERGQSLQLTLNGTMANLHGHFPAHPHRISRRDLSCHELRGPARGDLPRRRGPRHLFPLVPKFTSERSSPPKLRFTAQDHRGSSASQTTAFRSATSERGPKEAFDGAVARSPIEPGKGRVVHAAKVRGSSAGESVGDASGTGALVVVDLTGRTLQAAVMVEPLQTAEHLGSRRRDQRAGANAKSGADSPCEESPRRAQSFPSEQMCLRAESADAGGTSSPHFTMKCGATACLSPGS